MAVAGRAGRAQGTAERTRCTLRSGGQPGRSTGRRHVGPRAEGPNGRMTHPRRHRVPPITDGAAPATARRRREPAQMSSAGQVHESVKDELVVRFGDKWHDQFEEDEGQVRRPSENRSRAIWVGESSGMGRCARRADERGEEADPESDGCATPHATQVHDKIINLDAVSARLVRTQRARGGGGSSSMRTREQTPPLRLRQPVVTRSA